MTRFETLNGESLGATFFGGKGIGRLKFLSQEEQQTLWNLHEDTLVISDNGWEGKLSTLLDLFSETKTATAEQMTERGWGDRLESGLALRQTITDDGKLAWIK
jgi:hypothetical protein